jgi:hypothetical protein
MQNYRGQTNVSFRCKCPSLVSFQVNGSRLGQLLYGVSSGDHCFCLLQSSIIRCIKKHAQFRSQPISGTPGATLGWWWSRPFSRRLCVVPEPDDSLYCRTLYSPTVSKADAIHSGIHHRLIRSLQRQFSEIMLNRQRVSIIDFSVLVRRRIGRDSRCVLTFSWEDNGPPPETQRAI